MGGVEVAATEDVVAVGGAGGVRGTFSGVTEAELMVVWLGEGGSGLAAAVRVSEAGRVAGWDAPKSGFFSSAKYLWESTHISV